MQLNAKTYTKVSKFVDLAQGTNISSFRNTESPNCFVRFHWFLWQAKHFLSFSYSLKITFRDDFAELSWFFFFLDFLFPDVTEPSDPDTGSQYLSMSQWISAGVNSELIRTPFTFISRIFRDFFDFAILNIIFVKWGASSRWSIR